VKLNCAAIPTDLLESELFGHEKGAFTGAVAQKMCRFEAANGGTLFLDEIGDIPLELQSKLLRVLQEQEFERLGSTYTRRVDVGVVAATIQDLAGLIANKQFRMDLYYRLNVFPMTLPLLRLRMDDIPMLVAHFVQNFGECMSKRISKIPKRAMDTLMRFSRTPISGIRGIHGIKVIRGIEIAMHLSFTLIIKYLRMAEVLLSLVSRDGTTQSLQQEGRTMRSAKRYAFRLSSKRCSTCEDLRPLHARSEAALRNARSLYRATVKAIDSAALQNLEGELKQTSASRKLICYAIQAHLTSQHTQTRGVAWRRYGPGKES
jgi:formate hydrogenlyase transcriptional activator